MSTKLTKAAGKPNVTGSPDGKSEPTLESLRPAVDSALPNPHAGKQIINVMTPQETANLLARLQDVLSLWSGSDNKIIGRYVMTAFPIPEGVDITKLKTGHDNQKVFCVNGVAVTAVMTEEAK